MDPYYGFFPSLIHQVKEKEGEKKAEWLQVSNMHFHCFVLPPGWGAPWVENSA